MTLSPELVREWFDQTTPKERAEQTVLLSGETADAFEWFRISLRVDNVRNQGPTLIEPHRKTAVADIANND